MLSRRLFLKSGAAATTYLAIGIDATQAANAPGITDTEISFGQTMAYSGPASAYGVQGRVEAAYFKMINDQGGVNGRKLNLISVDDGYSPPRTVEQTRRLVEQEEVAFIFGSLGTPTSAAIQSYLNEAKVPQLFIATGASRFADPKGSPWTIPFYASYQTEWSIYGKQIFATNMDAKVGLLYQNDDTGADARTGLRNGLGVEHAALIVKEASYEVSDPTIDSQIVTLQAAGADTVLIAATPKFAAQAIRKIYDIGWAPTRYLGAPSSSIEAVLKPAGLNKSKGVITARFLKDPTDPRWKDDAGCKQWAAFVAKYLAPAQRDDQIAIYGFSAAAMIVQVLKQCGDDLSRENIMRQAANIKDLELPMLLPGIRVNTSADDFRPIRQMQLSRFDGESWELFGGLMID
jgi:branched-chain amino acid transport system substrate-binding protein